MEKIVKIPLQFVRDNLIVTDKYLDMIENKSGVPDKIVEKVLSALPTDGFEEKVTIPKYVANVIESTKAQGNTWLFAILRSTFGDSSYRQQDYLDWVIPNLDLFLLALVNGYCVEETPKVITVQEDIPMQPQKNGGWTIQPYYLMGIRDQINSLPADTRSAVIPDLSTIETVLLALQSKAGNKES